MGDLEICLWGAFGAIALFLFIAWIRHEVRKGPGRRPNKRRGLPAPRPDERDSIQQLRRIMSHD